ncbi:nitrate transport ATP-binding protein [Blastopirellula marina DSM 3645]|uniref:Nitrate transport ATP-binding protein n=2 Tax=Blastopirellula marina TaxID=124 RepID=A3ZZX6_9BACT|nr:nitrate transport ATP-binding protein [Blastopirellula marina DSM 3645]
MFWLVCAGFAICGCGQQRSGPSLQDLDIDALAAEATAAMKVLGKEQPGAVSAAKSDRPSSLRLEKTKLKFGFIKLTDCAPLVIAKEQGFFADEGLQVEIEAQPNWKTLLERVISGELDGAHMLSGQPIASTIGINGEAHVITAFTMDQNGNAITVSNSIWEEMQKADPALQSSQPKHPISADALRSVVADRKASGDLLKMGMVFPVSTHNYELRYWLAAAGIHPGMYTSADTTGVTDAEVLLSVTPPPMMPQVMEVGTIQGYCVGEPWNQQAVVKGIGVPVVTNYDIWKNNPEKVFGVTKAWNDENRNTHVAVVKALIQAGKWLDEVDAAGKFVNRESAVQLLSKANYVGADVDVIRNSMTGYFYFQKSDKRELPDFNVFFKSHATYPWYSDGVWFLTQMRRWGQITEPKSAEWYGETAKKIYRPDIYREAAERLISEGKLDRSEVPGSDTDGYKPPTAEFIDGITFDGHDPITYLNAHKIGNKDE